MKTTCPILQEFVIWQKKDTFIFSLICISKNKKDFFFEKMGMDLLKSFCLYFPEAFLFVFNVPFHFVTYFLDELI